MPLITSMKTVVGTCINIFLFIYLLNSSRRSDRCCSYNIIDKGTGQINVYMINVPIVKYTVH